MADHNSITGLDSYVSLQEFIEKHEEGEASGFESYEVELGEHMRALENELKAAKLARYNVDADAIWVDGREWRRCLTGEPKTYLSTSGPVSVPRNLYRPIDGGKAICPLELRAGIVGGLHTPGLARQICYLMGHMTSVETANVFKEFGVDGPSSSTCDRLPKVLSAHWEQNRQEWEDALRLGETVPGEAAVMSVSLDGVMVPDKEGQREAKARREEGKKNLVKATGGPAGYREVGCGTVTLYDSDGKRLETVRYGREPEYKKKTLTEQLDAEVASILTARPDLVLVALADGAEENWRYFDGPSWEQATKVVDFGHACEHLRDAMRSYHGATSVEGRAEYERLKVILKEKEDGISQVLAELRRLERRLTGPKCKARREGVSKERNYFENQSSRMDYARYRAQGLPIGSGIVEAACKTLATQRLKRSGMSWGNGKQAILTIRSLQQSARWDRAWRLIASAFTTDVLAYEQCEKVTLCAA